VQHPPHKPTARPKCAKSRKHRIQEKVMKETVLNLIQEHQAKTGNMSGYSVVDLKNDLQIRYKELRTILKKLYQEKDIKIRRGINAPLIFLPKKHNSRL